MSKVRAEQYTNRLGTGAPEIPFGVTLPEGASIDGAGGLNLTGIATAGTFKGNIEATTASFSGNVSIGGTLTYEDVTNIDSVGIITARSGIKVTGGNVELSQGAGTGYYQITQASGNTVKFGIVSGSNIELSGTSNNDFYIKLNGNNERLRINSNGQIGIATAAPAGTLHIQGNQVGAIVAMAANDVDCSLGNYFTKTITASTTFTFSNVPSGVEYSFTMEVTLNGSNSIGWPTSVKWNADTAPTLTDGKTQLFMFLTSNGGTRWRGSALVDYVN